MMMDDKEFAHFRHFRFTPFERFIRCCLQKEGLGGGGGVAAVDLTAHMGQK